MSGTLFFVHGTGVRQEGLDQTWDRFKSGAEEHGLGHLKLARSDWGVVVGPDLSSVAAALPKEAAPDARPPDDENSAAAWALLINDPWFELALVAQGEQRSQLMAGATPEVEASGRAGNLAGLEEHPAVAEAGVTAEELRNAGVQVAGRQEFRDAVRKMGSAIDDDLIDAIARAIVAAVLRDHRSRPLDKQPAVAFDRALRAALVAAVAKSYAPETTMGVTDWIKRRAKGFATRLVTNYAVPRRAEGMGMASPAISDILFYQQRGDSIRDYVAKDLAGLERPIVAVGHSLGGIILFDLLSGKEPPACDLLVTVGSQAPLFYVIDALEYVRPGGAVAHFEPWVNLYNQEDLLSFCAERVFPNSEVADFEVDAGVPFPESHSAYWSQSDTYDKIRAAYEEIHEHWTASL